MNHSTQDDRFSLSIVCDNTLPDAALSGHSTREPACLLCSPASTRELMHREHDRQCLSLFFNRRSAGVLPRGGSSTGWSSRYSLAPSAVCGEPGGFAESVATFKESEAAGDSRKPPGDMPWRSRVDDSCPGFNSVPWVMATRDVLKGGRRSCQTCSLLVKSPDARFIALRIRRED